MEAVRVVSWGSGVCGLGPCRGAERRYLCRRSLKRRVTMAYVPDNLF